MQPVIYADLRCLQDYGYRVRGIGQHFRALLRARLESQYAGWMLIGLTDPACPKLPSEIAALVGQVTSSVNPILDGEPAVFIDATPMTHDTRFSLRFLNHPGILCAAVIYDFIPLDWPGYLPSTASRIDYLAKIARLKRFGWFFPISQYTAWRTAEVLGTGTARMTVTGASVRRCFYERSHHAKVAKSKQDSRDPYFLIVTASDPRKNSEVVVRALKHINLLYGQRIVLKIAGHYDDAYKHHLLKLAGQGEDETFLDFCPDASDDELISLYLGALALIAPSHIEGFSLPIVEASVCGCPVIASTCAAHLELIEQPEALFPSQDAGALSERLGALLGNPTLRDSLVAAQAHLGARFHESAVGERFWTGIREFVEHSQPNTGILLRKKAKVAFLAPYPPDSSEAALCTALALRAGGDLFNSDLYTDAPRPLTIDGQFRDCGPASIAPLLSGQYKAIISILGNDSAHLRILDIFERSGGPCILYDTPLTRIYFKRFGRDGFLNFATRLLGRSVSIEEVDMWLQARNLPSLFLESIVQRASPLIVHSAMQQAEIKNAYGVEPELLPCCPVNSFSDDELSAEGRKSARERLGMPAGAFVISIVGDVSEGQRLPTSLAAIDLLRAWNIPAELRFIGRSNVSKEEAYELADFYGIAEHVHFDSIPIGTDIYRDYLIASDAALQLRPDALGQPSMLLADCISAGIRTVTSEDLALSCGAPTYISTVPMHYSPLQVAEQLALIWEAPRERSTYSEARRTYLETHNFKVYAHRLSKILSIA
jgi:glycosyltransferase involved in cell wall biosynthesis